MAERAAAGLAARARQSALQAQRVLAVGDAATALRLADEALALSGVDIFARIIRGQALMALGRLREAATAFSHVSKAVPKDAGVQILLGNARRGLGEHAAAADAYRAAIGAQPDMAGAWHNLGLALIALDRPVEASKALRHACALEPDAAAHWNSLGAALYDRGAVEPAICAFTRAGHVATPGGREARRAAWNEGLLRLSRGEMRRGWALYDHRAGGPEGEGPPPFGLPFVRGMPRPGLRVLITVEQGLGDIIMVLRFIPLLAAQGVQVYLQRPEPLRRLLVGFPGVTGFVDDGAALPDLDGVLPCMSLPRLFVEDAGHIPGTTPYLRPDPALVEQWRPALAPATGLRVGFVWAGNPDHSRDRHRSVPLAAMLPVMQLPGITPVILQKGGGRSTMGMGDGLPANAIDLGPALTDVADTLAVLAHLDLLVTCCTMPAHLAGAAGVPAYVLLDRAPDWRWGLDCSTSPWYYSIRLYRQEQASDWSSPVGRIAADLSRR